MNKNLRVIGGQVALEIASKRFPKLRVGRVYRIECEVMAVERFSEKRAHHVHSSLKFVLHAPVTGTRPVLELMPQPRLKKLK